MNKIIAIVGMPGSGKSEAGVFFKQKGWEVLRFGSVIDDGLQAEGVVWTPESNAYYREKIRKELGMAAVAIKMMPKITLAVQSDKNVILDGLYSWEEYSTLKEKFSYLLLLCLYARPEVRYERLAVRKERAFTKEESRQRDISEIEHLNKGGPIAIADYLIKNEGTTEELQREMGKFWSWIGNE
ncbi:MAG TPA: AAA family ATPase [Candidatus Saccharimonadales bacterium]|nr:AAA family ATPase [Candidatus Saccharimonadales bacterium]